MMLKAKAGMAVLLFFIGVSTSAYLSSQGYDWFKGMSVRLGQRDLIKTEAETSLFQAVKLFTKYTGG